RPRSTLLPYATLFRSSSIDDGDAAAPREVAPCRAADAPLSAVGLSLVVSRRRCLCLRAAEVRLNGVYARRRPARARRAPVPPARSEEHTSELQSRENL